MENQDVRAMVKTYSSQVLEAQPSPIGHELRVEWQYHVLPPPLEEFPRAGAEPRAQVASPAREAAAKAEPKQERSPRELLRRTFVLDALACVRRGGRLKSAGVPDSNRRGARHSGAPGTVHATCSTGSSTGAPQSVGC